jgi:membrane-bound lytic murein transglycosylase D
MTLKRISASAVTFFLIGSAFAADPASPSIAPAALEPGSITIPPAAADSTLTVPTVIGSTAATPSMYSTAAQPAAAQPQLESSGFSGPLIGNAPPAQEPIVEVLEPPEEPRYRDLWERIRAGFAMAEVESPLVARHEAWYLNRPEYVQRMVERSRLYLFFVVDELERRGMPTEIALLPMIESAYNPQAYSRMRAAGMWQFIPSTGKKYGLQQNFWYDGRRDVLAATRAALDYLQFLHGMFGDWELALAAYNCGEGGVMRAINKNRAKKKATDYYSIKLPKETRNYLPKLQAVKNIINDLDALDLELQGVPNEPYFTVVTAPGHMDVMKAAELADMPVEEFRSLNPGYNRPVMIKAAARQILLPIDKVDEFHANLESNDGPLVTWQTYTLKKGETLDKVAAKFDTSVQRLKEVNGLNGRTRVQPGRMLIVPLEKDDAETNLDETYNHRDFKASPEEYSASVRYKVKRGETLSSIARKHRTSVARIKAINGLKSNNLRVGQRLVIYQDQRPVNRVSVSYKPKIRRVSN